MYIQINIYLGGPQCCPQGCPNIDHCCDYRPKEDGDKPPLINARNKISELIKKWVGE